MQTLTCSFLCLGLIGGSIARAFREYFPDVKIKVYAENNTGASNEGCQNRRNLVYSKKKLKTAPGEMEHIILKAEDFADAEELFFELEVNQHDA